MYVSGGAVVRDNRTGEIFELPAEELEWSTMTEGDHGPKRHSVSKRHPQLGRLSWEVTEFPPGVEAGRLIETNGHTLVQDFKFGIEADPHDPADRDVVVDGLVTWFFQHYSHPRHNTGIDEADGDYIWDHGGPYYAREELDSEFYDFPKEAIELAVRRIEKDGQVEWSAGDWWDGHRNYVSDEYEGVARAFAPRPFYPDIAPEYADDSLEIPEQGPGLSFQISTSGLIESASSGDVTSADLKIIEALRVVLQDATDELVSYLNGTNAYAALAATASKYQTAISATPLSLDLVYALGVRLENTRARLELQERQGELPPMDAGPGEALDSVLAIHGPFLLSTERGRELVSLAKDYAKSDFEVREYRLAAGNLVRAISQSRELTTRDTADLLEVAVNDLGTGPHPDRSLQIAHSGVRNWLILAASGAALLVGQEVLLAGVAASAPGLELSAATTLFINNAAAFLSRYAPIIHQFAAACGMADMGWLPLVLRRLKARFAPD